MNLSGTRMSRARMLKGGWYAKIASLLTPSSVKTACRNCTSAVALVTMAAKVFDSIDTRMVRNKVFPKKAKVTMREGPRIW